MHDIWEYIKRSKDERQAHLRLSDPCIERGGHSVEFRGLLAVHLDTTIPAGRFVNLCHACHNGACSNPNHLYWGSAGENRQDAIANDPGQFTRARDTLIERLGNDKAKEFYREIGRRGGQTAKQEGLSDDEIAERQRVILECDPSKRGWISRASKRLNISHTQIGRFVNKYGFNKSSPS